MSSTNWSSIMKISQRVIKLWPAQYFITMGDKSRTQSVRVVFLVRDTPTQCPLPNGEVSSRVLELWAAQDLTTMGGNSKTESARVVFFVYDMPTQCSLHIGEVSWKYRKGFQSYGPHKILQFWETLGDNSWTKPIRVVILARDTPTQCPLESYKVSWK